LFAQHLIQLTLRNLLLVGYKKTQG